jgi:iron only hydrogenase large subunit-like protein/nitrogen-specific signal transduction histidine kinase
MSDLCVNCGTCIRVCVTKAKVIESDIGVVQHLLATNSQVIAIPSSSFPAAMPEMRPGQFVSALKKLGFSEVMEDAFGAEMVCREYSRLLKEKKEGPIFSSTCPAVVSYVEKFYPQLVDHLAPIVSPMIAMGRLIKQDNPQAKVVFIGPCAAKKAESKDENVAGVIDAVLTFPEVTEMFTANKVDLKDLPEGKFSGPKPNMARLFAMSGGLLKTTGYTDDIIHNEIINAHGRDYIISLLAEIAQGDIDTHFINFFFCHGCINGPAIDNNLSIFRRRELVAKYAESDADPEQTEMDLQKYACVDLRRKFKAQNISLPTPSDNEVQDILNKMGKSDRANQFNCGACGYRTCRDLAKAVALNQAETTMCWPYLLSELKETQAGLIQAEKLTSLGQMAASIAHEVNNPLSGVLVYTQLMNKKISNDNLSKDSALNYLVKMENELTRSTRLIRNLLDFSRQSTPALKETDINDVIKRSLELVINSAQLRHIKIIEEFNPALPRFRADPDQLQQVCVNLILNAVQAMPDGGTLTLRTMGENGQIKMEVQDTGCGISAENMPKLFTPFFTTKKEVKGVGLGLAVSYGIIQRHSGKISVTSNEGEGTTFSIHLPVKYAEKN